MRISPLTGSGSQSIRLTWGFTLIELLVVISIIALLLSILLPTLAKVRETGKTIICLSNSRSIGTAMTLYLDDEKGFFPRHRGALFDSWAGHLMPYLGNTQYISPGLLLTTMTATERQQYYSPLWDLVCPFEIPGPILPTTYGSPLIYAYNFGLNGFPWLGVSGTYADGYGIYDFNDPVGLTRNISEITLPSEAMVLGEMYGEDYIGATHVQWDGLPGYAAIVDYKSRHSGGNTGTFSDGHARIILEEKMRDPESEFWRVAEP